MISLICFLLTLAGSVNWFCIGVLQYDYVAGLFGSQANVFSRIVYTFIGISSVWLVFALIKGRGKLKIDGKRSTDQSLLLNKKKMAHNTEASQMESFNGISNHPNLNDYNNLNNYKTENYSRRNPYPQQHNYPYENLHNNPNEFEE
jgi:uncharacterized membrane protein YuzA (DUF378 family)